MSILSFTCPTCGQRKRRSIPQNKRYFALLTAAQDKLGYSSHVIHEYMKQKFLPCKIVHIGNEDKIISGSTADLPMHGPETPNWDDYSMQVEVFLATQGIYLDDEV